MKKLISMKYVFPLLFIITAWIAFCIGSSKAGTDTGLEDWIGRKVDVKLGSPRGQSGMDINEAILRSVSDTNERHGGIVVEKGTKKIFVYHGAIQTITLERF